MPLVHISLLKGKPPAYVRAIADGVHQALVEAFETPADDHFQIVQQLEPEALIFSPDYLDIERTRDIVVVQIVASETRTTATKQNFYKVLASNLARNPGVRIQDVQVILSPNEREDWSFGNGVASYAAKALPDASGTAASVTEEQ
jgi:phenylpyruvate tautomerase PptA (4-oxalocrotonate tautomerase family)